MTANNAASNPLICLCYIRVCVCVGYMWKTMGVDLESIVVVLSSIIHLFWNDYFDRARD